MENVTPYIWEFFSFAIFMAIMPAALITAGICYKRITNTIMGHMAMIGAGFLGLCLIVVFVCKCGLLYFPFFISINLMIVVGIYETLKICDFFRRRADPYYDQL